VSLDEEDQMDVFAQERDPLDDIPLQPLYSTAILQLLRVTYFLHFGKHTPMTKSTFGGEKNSGEAMACVGEELITTCSTQNPRVLNPVFFSSFAYILCNRNNG
jgi:hypothetical protein